MPISGGAPRSWRYQPPLRCPVMAANRARPAGAWRTPVFARPLTAHRPQPASTRPGPVGQPRAAPHGGDPEAETLADPLLRQVYPLLKHARQVGWQAPASTAAERSPDSPTFQHPERDRELVWHPALPGDAPLADPDAFGLLDGRWQAEGEAGPAPAWPTTPVMFCPGSTQNSIVDHRGHVGRIHTDTPLPGAEAAVGVDRIDPLVQVVPFRFVFGRVLALDLQHQVDAVGEAYQVVRAELVEGAVEV